MLNPDNRKVLKARLNKDIEKMSKQITKLENDIAKNDEILNTKRNRIVELKDNFAELSQLLQNL